MIDVHSHLASSKVFSSHFLSGIAEDMFQKLPPESRTPRSKIVLSKVIESAMNDHDGDRLASEMEQCGVTKCVVLLIDLFYRPDGGMEELEISHEIHYRALQRHSDKFVVFSGIDPRRGEAGVELLKCAFDVYGFGGLKLYPPCGFEVNDPRLWPLYTLCQERSLPVLIHTGPSLPDMPAEQKFPGSLSEAAQSFPDVNFIAAHAFLGNVDVLLEIARRTPNLFLDTSGFQLEGVRGQTVLSRISTAMDLLPRQVVFGSDWPLFNFPVPAKRWVEHMSTTLDLSPEKRQLLFDENARSALHLRE